MFHFGKMIDMAKTPAEAKEEIARDAPMAVSAAAPSVPTYPYGLCLSLDDDSLAKLKLGGDLPTVGDEIHFCCEARVTSASESERETSDGKTEKCCRVELQICRMSVPGSDPVEAAEEKAEARRGHFYGPDKAA